MPCRRGRAPRHADRNDGGEPLYRRLAIGPVVARETDVALALFRSLVVGYDGEIRIEVPTRHTRVLDELVALGGRRFDDAPVMRYGAAAMPGCRDEIYALASRGFG